MSWKGKVVSVLRKESAMKFLEKISHASPNEAQLIMAKVTGNFKRGNERNPSRK
ncbi:MAG: ABC transporter ATP-binding protein [Candidatus Thorarchaeota archaeon]|nr:MAG: ABC transporter ATP-binding protein [Candidatus Thorarchaeota archaeon]